MRIRPLAALSTVALATVLLAGCSGGTPEAAPSPSSSAGADLCSVAAPGGDVVDAVTVSGEVGQSAAAEFAAPLEVSSAERAVAIEGDGAAISDGDYVQYAVAVFDAATGETLQEAGFGDAPLPAEPITLGSGADQFFGCATEGSRIVMTVPPAQEGGAQVYVIDVLGITPAAEWCAPEEPGESFPSVEWSADAAPTVTIPPTEPPAEVQLEVLNEGDGDVVQPGDSVTVNYTGVKWSDGTTFDSSWERGEPATFTTTGVVAGFKSALEGQKVGSTVVVSMPPVCGYGETGTSQHELAGETLVFVVDIVEAARPE
ncbi:FKBP-type peptidyl-prolyl cis-trans isomerase [Micromonospora sp. DT81.3]|uniref:FKBP-type peptidyl-prolyl cis-trans isomerase n=1 Tax=Actinomycetes TaxID=1760 RepID=UPI003CF86170